MRKTLIIVLILFWAGTAQASLLANGDFEAPAAGSGNLYNTAWDARGWNVWDALPGWSVLSGPGIEVEKSGVVTRSQSGRHHVELDSHGGTDTNSVMFQSLYLASGSYDLSFWYFARTNNAGNDNGIFAGIADAASPFDYSLFYGTVSKTRNETRGLWEEVNWSFDIEAAGTYHVTFGAYGRDNSLGGLIDNVSLHGDITPVPEPSVFLLFGFGLLGITMIARRQLCPVAQRNRP